MESSTSVCANCGSIKPFLGACPNCGGTKNRGGRPKGAKSKSQVTLSLTEDDRATLQRIAAYYSTGASDAVRTMIRYFEIHLGLGGERGKP